ncbi:MAG: efflux RND transporter periplasmic adaptor subunit [Deltaproteobacteria bacterium]|nr:efflux RND transporter periplasmic adaptor subunit [Deltaproteobacteria bacterium]
MHQPVMENAKEIWTCSMHPQVKRDKPGTCPICYMKLVKAEIPKNINSQIQPMGHAAFQLSQERIQMIGVKTGVVQRKELFKSVRASGRVAFDPDLYSAQSEYIEAIKQAQRTGNSNIPDIKQSAQRMIESAKLRLKILGMSDAQILKLKSTEYLNQNLLLHQAGEDVWVYAEIYEMDLPYVTSGLDVEVSVGFLHTKPLQGKVVSVDRVLNAATRTAKARILVPKAKAELRPETYVDVKILSPLGMQITIPMDAVLDTGTQAWVFIDKGQGMFEARLIQIKFRVEDEVVIQDGLNIDEKIVTSGNFLIDSESRLKAVLMEDVATPSCQKGQHWDAGMKMCHPD